MHFKIQNQSYNTILNPESLTRHGPEVPKFGTQILGSLLQSPPTYILLNLKTKSQSISTRPQLGLIFENATTLIQTMAGLLAALQNFLLLLY